LRGNVIEVDVVEEKIEQLRPSLDLLWDELEQGNISDAEFGLNTMIKTYAKYFYDKSYRMIELKEKLAYVYELQKKLREAMKLWLECYYATRQVEGEDNYECLFFLLKITSALIEESDGLVDEKNYDRIRANLEKISKYFKRAVIVSKKLKGKEARLLETRDEILQNMPDLQIISRDMKNLQTLCSMVP
jgi:hypothetical protein